VLTVQSPIAGGPAAETTMKGPDDIMRTDIKGNRNNIATIVARGLDLWAFTDITCTFFSRN
jgi:hypothetical protein